MHFRPLGRTGFRPSRYAFPFPGLARYCLVSKMSTEFTRLICASVTADRDHYLISRAFRVIMSIVNKLLAMKNFSYLKLAMTRFPLLDLSQAFGFDPLRRRH